MLLTRQEMTFDFGGAQFDLERDRDLLGWILSQFLYGEITGVQVGRWLEQAPDFDAAQFLARQANEEMAHVKLFLRALDSLGVDPQPPHRALRFLATDFAGATYLEHCFLEMALGEGLVLVLIYALIDTLPASDVRTMLAGLARQEEGHVAFGEEQTRRILSRDRSAARHLLGLGLVSIVAVRKLADGLQARYGDHPVLGQMRGFLKHTEDVAELRMRRLGITKRPIASIAPAERTTLIAIALARRYGRALNPFRKKPADLTRTYLRDPAIRARLGRTTSG